MTCPICESKTKVKTNKVYRTYVWRKRVCTQGHFFYTNEFIGGVVKKIRKLNRYVNRKLKES